MSAPKSYITFILIDSETEHRINTFRGEYRNLRDLISDKLFLEGFGDCGGMGRCATCMVEVEGLNGEASQMKRNELVTLAKASVSNVRLACQIAIDDDISNASIRIRTSV